MDTENSPNPSFYHRANNFLQKNVLGLIILGIFTSALWDLMKGTSGILFNALLRTSVYIFQSYVDRIHLNIGESSSDQLVKTIYQVISLFAISLYSSFATNKILKAITRHREVRKLKLKIQKWEEQPPSSEELDYEITTIERGRDDNVDPIKRILDSLDGLKNKANSAGFVVRTVEAATDVAKMLKIYAYGYSVGILILLIVIGAISAGDAYTRGAGVFVERSIEILAPNIPPDKHLQLRARYRSVDTPQKFYDLHDELQTLAKEKSVTLPKFSVIKR